MGPGLPHGRVHIGDGAVRKADVLAEAKGRNMRASNSESYRNLANENDQLHRANAGLTQQNEALTKQQEVDHQLIIMLFSELGKEPPKDLLRRRQQLQTQLHSQGGASSHGSEPIDGMGQEDGGISTENNGSAAGLENNENADANGELGADPI